jgi:hypothetical protein
MLKKITILFVFNVIAMHNSFAMEKEKTPIRPSKKNNHIFIGLGKFNKHEQDLNNQLQNLNSDKKSLINDNDQIKEHIKENWYSIAGSNIIQKTAHSLPPFIDHIMTVSFIVASKHIKKKNMDSTAVSDVIETTAHYASPIIEPSFIETIATSCFAVVEVCNEQLTKNIRHAENNIKRAELKLKENNKELRKIDQDENNIIFSLSRLKKKERLVKQVLLKKAQRSYLNNSYHQPEDVVGKHILNKIMDAAAGIDILSKISDYMYAQEGGFQAPDSHSYHIVKKMEQDSFDETQKWFLSEQESSDSHMVFGRSDEDFSTDQDFLSKRPFTKNGNRVMVCFRDPSSSISAIFEKEDSIDAESIIDGYNLVDFSLNMAIGFGRNNRDGSSDVPQDLISLIDRFYHHQYRYYTNKYSYYNDTKEMLSSYVCLSEYILKIKENYNRKEDRNSNNYGRLCLDEILYKGMLTLKIMTFQNMIW